MREEESDEIKQMKLNAKAKGFFGRMKDKEEILPQLKKPSLKKPKTKSFFAKLREEEDDEIKAMKKKAQKTKEFYAKMS